MRSDVTGLLTDINLTPTAYTAVPPPAFAVPEPSSWLLVLLGFAAIGLVLRYSRRTHPARA